MFRIFLESHNLKNPYSGFGQFNLNLIKALSNKKNENFKFTFFANRKNKFKTKLNPNFEQKNYFPFYRKIPIFKKFDLWHCLNQNTKIEPFFKIPYILTVHDVNFIYNSTENQNHSRNELFVNKLRKASAITYVSEFTKKETHKYFEVPDVPEFVIYNGNSISTHDVKNSKEKKTDTPYYYSIGDFLERKNFHVLVRMMKHIKNKKLIISGSLKKDYSKFVKKQIETHHLEDRVILTDKVSDEEKLEYMKGCEAFLFPSEHEGFGLPPIEAMTFGKPVFLYNHSSLPEIGGDVAFYWENLDPKQMVEKLNLEMKNFKKNSSAFEEKIKRRANYFCWDKAAEEYLAVYKTVLDKNT